MITNEEKHEVYAQLKTRLKKALQNGFWFEACMIEYNIIEDRTASILFHAGITGKGWEKKLTNKLNSIELQIGKKNRYVFGKVSPDTLKAIRVWKENRNDAVHRACISTYDEKCLQQLAEEGKSLCDRISNENQKVKRATQKG